MQEEEIVFTPAGITANSASGMHGALEVMLRQSPSLWNALRGFPTARDTVITPGGDMFAANQMLYEHISNVTSAAGSIFVLKGYCHQHKSGNAMEPVLKRRPNDND